MKSSNNLSAKIQQFLSKINTAPVIASEIARYLCLETGYEMYHWGLILQDFRLSNEEIFHLLPLMVASYN
jgi:hypothetical protein